MSLAPWVVLLCLAFSGCAERRARDHVARLADPSAAIRQDASIELIEIGPPAVRPLIEAADRGSDSLKYIAAQILGNIGDSDAIPFLRRCAQERNVFVRQEAVRALGSMGEAALIPTLVQMLKSDPHPQVRIAAAQGLGNLRDTSVVAPLIEALEDSMPLVRHHVLQVLNRLWNPSVERVVLRAVKDPDETIRYIAVQMLGQRQTSQGLEILRAVLRDPNPWIRAEAAYSLSRLGDPRVVPDLEHLLGGSDPEDPDYEAARQALRTLTGMDYAVE
ncbi:MAG: HEAT repeat domain-containing protein [Candidatus Latescibacteria bacterium]|nr:HEAT repeat domain-containing protein [Candidatus Latescibacterota bacterium]